MDTRSASTLAAARARRSGAAFAQLLAGRRRPIAARASNCAGLRPANSARMMALCAGFTLALSIPAGAHARAEVLAVRTIGLTVSDLDRSERFYRDTLDFRTVARKHLQDPALDALFGLPTEEMDVLTMQLGDQQVEFTRFERPGRPYPAGSRSPDLWFQHFAIVVSDMDAAYARVRAAGVPPISFGGPETLPEQNGGVRAFKFRDPDGHPLELLWFPPGQGRAIWQQRAGLFLGIDHSAIAVASTDTSLAFYHGLLGAVCDQRGDE